MPAVLKVYSSSAGSGKTYTLTKEYLKLALHTPDPSYYRTILSITFTNDAAAEMKERILHALRSLQPENGTDLKEKRKAEELLQAITNELNQEYPGHNYTTELLRIRAKEVFIQILFHYADFAVSTIDSFVNKVVQAFTRELNIPFNFEVDLDAATLLNTAVAMLLDQVKDGEGNLLANTLEQYAEEKASEGKSWNSLPTELAEFGQNLLNEQVYEAVLSLQKLKLDDFRKIRTELQKKLKTIESEIQTVAKEGTDLIQNAGIPAEAFANGKLGIPSYFEGLVKEVDLEKPYAYAHKTFASGKFYSGKASALDKANIDGISGGLTDCYNRIEAIKNERGSEYTLIKEMIPNLYKLSVLNELEKCMQEIKKDKNLVHISEFNKKITDIVLHEPIPFIYERLGEKYHHILIDEFQDTSALQWNNLLPLIDNTLAGGHFNLVVGDAKQAIYRWRGGDLEQILHLYKRQTENLYENRRNEEILSERYQSVDHSLRPQNLNTNYRSDTQIINFNNELFRFIADHKGREFETLQGIYDETFPQIAPSHKNEKGGLVQVIFASDEDPNFELDLQNGNRTETLFEGYDHEQIITYSESNFDITLQLVKQALNDGYSLKDIAILSRRNANSREIATFLKEKGYAIISSDSLSLQNAEVVNLLIALFRIFNRPDDGLARAEALGLIYKIVLEEPVNSRVTEEIAAVADDARSEIFFNKVRALGYDLKEKETGNLSLYELTEKLIRILDLLGKNNECEYLFRFLDLVMEYSLNNSNNLANFLQYWDLHKEKLSINTPKDLNAITITSIHKAKGLAYPVVIVPFADWSVVPMNRSLLWGKLNEENAPVEKLDVAVVGMSSRLENTALKAQYQTELERTFIENLNMLYVALTRPEHRLYLIAKKLDFTKEGNMKNISYFLHAYLVNKGLWDVAKPVFTLAEDFSAFQAKNATVSGHYSLEALHATDWEKRLKLKQHANNIFDFETQQQQRNWSRRLHYALSRLTTAEELETVLNSLKNQGIISRREMPEFTERLQTVVQHPQMQHYFSNEVVFENEKEILDVRTLRYKPDRIVFDAKTNAVTLIDFKLPPEKNEYIENLNSYAQLFAELMHSDITCLLYFFEEERVHKWKFVPAKAGEQIGLGI